MPPKCNKCGKYWTNEECSKHEHKCVTQKPTVKERIEKIIENSKLYQGFGSNWHVRMSLKNQLADALISAGLIFQDKVKMCKYCGKRVDCRGEQ